MLANASCTCRIHIEHISLKYKVTSLQRDVISSACVTLHEITATCNVSGDKCCYHNEPIPDIAVQSTHTHTHQKQIDTVVGS